MRGKNKKMRDGNKGYLKIAAAALIVSGISAGGFGMAASAAAKASLDSVQKIPTSYQVPTIISGLDVPSVSETEKTRATLQYHVMESSLNAGTPTETDLTMEEAAALGMKYLEDIMGFNLEEANVYMIYNSGTETFPRAFWSGDVRFGEEVLTDNDTWSFFIDAVTGELFNIGCTETLDVDIPLGYDASLETNCGIYAELAKDVAERCNLLGGKVTEVKYGSQGYSSNNPDITMEVYGETGQMAIISFSRYNQRLLGIITDTSRVITDRALENLMKEDVEASDWQTETLEDGSVIKWR